MGLGIRLHYDRLQTRLLVLFVILTIVPLILLGVLGGYYGSRTLEQQSIALQRQATARVGQALEAFVKQRVDELLRIDRVLGLARLDPLARRKILSKILMSEHAYQTLSLLAVRGREQIQLSRTEVLSGAHLDGQSSSAAFQYISEHHQPYVGPVQFDAVLREPLLEVAIPIIDWRTGQVAYGLLAEIRFKAIWKLLAQLELPNSVDVYVLNAAGQVVAHKLPATVLRNKTIPIPTRDGRSINPDGEEVIAVKYHLGFAQQPLIVLATQPVSEALRLSNNAVYLTAAATSTTILFALLLLLLLTRQVAMPVKRLASAARAIADGDLATAIEPGGRGEIGELATAFASMTARLRGIIAELEREEFEQRERAHVTLESIGDAVISTDADGNVHYLNPVAEELTGWSLSDARDQSLGAIFHIINEYNREPVADPVARCLAEGKVVGLANHTVLINRRGQELAIQDSAAPIRDQAGRVLGAVLVFSDVTEARRLQREISHQARHDTLTGLVNRREFEHAMQRVLQTVRIQNGEHALCYLDLDQFKLINDTCGHVAGDELLRQLTMLFQQKVRKQDTLGRLGGDEFGVLLENCGLDQALRVADGLRQAVEDFRFVWDKQSFNIGVSIGLVLIDTHSESVSAALRAADSACYVAKDAGRNRIHVYHEKDEDLNRRQGEMQWATKINRALEENRFQLYAQPIISLKQPLAETRHYELLLRLIDDNDRIVLPSAFLPAAERYNLATRIDRWVVASACNWLAQRPHLVDLDFFAINLSGQSLSDESFLTYVNQQLDTSSSAAERICFEVTETAAIANLTSATAFIEALKQRGCQFALDDFGSGLSSFAYLKNLPVDFLKIDGMFVKDIVNDPLDLAMVRSINEIGQLMGMKTVAEFVENDAILAKLRELGVDYAQGYGIGEPLVLTGIEQKGSG